jgi:hypothetical protein
MTDQFRFNGGTADDVPREAERLSHHWNAVVAGQHPAGELEPTLAQTIAELHARAAPAPPDPAFVAQLRADVLQHAATTGSAGMVVVVPADRSRSLVVMPPTRQEPRTLPGTRHAWRRPLAAVAALLLLAVVGVLAWYQPASMVHPPVPFVPAFVATSPAWTAPAIDRMVLRQQFEMLPADAYDTGMALTTLAPDAALALGTRTSYGVGRYLVQVRAGVVTLRVDGSAALTPAGAAARALSPGAAWTLVAGDVLAAPAGTVMHWHNASPEPVRLLSSKFSTMSDIGDLAPYPPTAAETTHVRSRPYTPPSGPFVLAVHELTLEPDEQVPGDVAGPIETLFVERGTLEVIWARRSDPATPTGTFPIRAGSGMGDLGVKRSVLHALRNPGPDRLVLLVQTIDPLDDDVTPQP